MKIVDFEKLTDEEKDAYLASSSQKIKNIEKLQEELKLLIQDKEKLLTEKTEMLTSFRIGEKGEKKEIVKKELNFFKEEK